MSVRRIIAVSPDEAMGRQLAIALRVAGGTVEVHPTLDALGPGDVQAALCVIHGDGELARAVRSILPRLTGDCRLIAVSPRADLVAVVELLRASDRVSGVVIAGDLDWHALSAMAMKAVTGDVFGIEKVVAPGVQIHAQVVGDHHDKALCMSQVSGFADLVGVPRAHRESIEQCIDEMVMNALYDAPVDEHGKPIFADVPTRTRISLRTEQTVRVEYACDGKQLAIAVRDAFGSLARDTVLRVLHKCLHAGQPIDDRAGGAGLGLYLMASSATTVDFHVAPGIATEVLCTFDLEAPKLALEHIGFFVEDRQPADGRAIGASPRPAEARRAFEPPGPPPRAAARLGLVMLICTAIAAAVLVCIAAWPMVFQRSGDRDVTVRPSAPAPSENTRIAPPLDASADMVRVRFVSDPPGAQVVQTGRPTPDPDRTYTPAEVLVEANQIQRFTLIMPNHAPLVIEPFTPVRGAGVLEKGGKLVELATDQPPAGGRR